MVMWGRILEKQPMIVILGKVTSHQDHERFDKRIDLGAGEAGGKKFGSVICFESCFSYLFREYPEADFIAVITNDAWYKLSSGGRRHQTQSIFRAIEMRRPLIRAANTGISCVIDAHGRTLVSLPLDETKSGHLIVDLPLPNTTPGVTPYMHSWGDWLSWLCLLYCVVRCFF